jgi:hypothetical protein
MSEPVTNVQVKTSTLGSFATNPLFHIHQREEIATKIATSVNGAKKVFQLRALWCTEPANLDASVLKSNSEDIKKRAMYNDSTDENKLHKQFIPK